MLITEYVSSLLLPSNFRRNSSLDSLCHSKGSPLNVPNFSDFWNTFSSLGISKLIIVAILKSPEWLRSIRNFLSMKLNNIIKAKGCSLGWICLCPDLSCTLERDKEITPVVCSCSWVLAQTAWTESFLPCFSQHVPAFLDGNAKINYSCTCSEQILIFNTVLQDLE